LGPQIGPKKVPMRQHKRHGTEPAIEGPHRRWQKAAWVGNADDYDRDI